MENREKVYVDILERLQDICQSMDIDMWLAGHAALSAVRGEPLRSDDVSVYVMAKDALRLEAALWEAAVRQPEGGALEVESPLSNERYPRYELRVSDPGTADIDQSDFFRYDNHGMHVTVMLLGQPPAKQGKTGALLKKLNKKLSGPAKTFEKWCTSQPGSPASLQSGKISFDTKLFTEKQDVDLGGISFYIPADAEGYFSAQFGLGWQFVDIPCSDHAGRMIDTENSIADRLDRIPAEEIRAYEKALKENKEGSSKHRDAQKYISRIHNVIDRSYDRIRFYRKLSAGEDRFGTMLVGGNLEELIDTLGPYLAAQKRYFDLGMDLYIDDTLETVTDKLLRRLGCTEYADALTDIAPGEKKPLVITDHHGEPLKEIPEWSAADDGDDAPEGELSMTQRTLLDMMKRVDAFLQDKGVEYFLFGGSLLGAIRHNGFIPWDDDMDIVMDRENYKKLVEAARDLPWDDISFDCCELDPKFHKPFGMFTLLRDTRFVDDRVYFGGAGMGTGIDVFVMDNVPRDDLEAYLKSSLLYQEVQTDETIKSADILKYRDEYFECKAKETEQGKESVLAELIAEMEKYGDKRPGQLQVVRLWEKKPRIYEPGMMEKPVMHRFEDAEFPVPARAEECLAAQYGDDWNVVPPAEERIRHAFKIDYELGALNYYRLIDDEVDWERAAEALSIRKQNRMKLLEQRAVINSFRKKLMADI